MILLKPSAVIEMITPNALSLIEQAGRTYYKSEDKITETSAEKFVKMIIDRGHETVLEHASATVTMMHWRYI
jgi:thymidylate synthase (FAD)